MAWWQTPIIPVLKKLRQGCLKFGDSLNYIVRILSQNKTQADMVVVYSYSLSPYEGKAGGVLKVQVQLGYVMSSKQA